MSNGRSTSTDGSTASSGDGTPADVLRQRLAGRQTDGSQRPLVIGIGGGTASGKTTLARNLCDALAPLRVQVVGQDRYFKPVAALPQYPALSRSAPWPDFNHPDSFRWNELLEHCRACADADVLVIEGILVLAHEALRALMDVRLYVEADADERIVRRIRRNLAAGMDIDSIADYYLESVRHQHARHNAPTREHADLIVPGGQEAAAARQQLVEILCAAVRVALVPAAKGQT